MVAKKRKQTPESVDVAANRRKLEQLVSAIASLAEQEREMSRDRVFPRSVPSDVADWFVAAANCYLAGSAKGIDDALGLRAGRGRPKKPGQGKVFQRDRIAWEKREFENKTWEQVLSELSEAGLIDDLSVSALRESVERREAQFRFELAEKASSSYHEPSSAKQPAAGRSPDGMVWRDNCWQEEKG